jgi:hypothetical protein
MALQQQISGKVSTPAVEEARGSASEHYTGVVIIHGIGAIKRNTTLQEAVDALSYWFNHEAELSLRPEGPGRIWVTATLTDDPNPDAPAARATMELEALGTSPTSAASVTTPTEPLALRLEWREVWWAESFGLPSVGATIRWARVQAREQVQHLLIPIGKKFGPAKAASRAPAHETPQALTYRPTGDRAGSPSVRTPFRTRMHRTVLQTVLWVYDLLQYVWKVLQWLMLTPVVLLLLLVLGVVRVLALIPFLRSSVVALVSAVFERIMLHWIAPLQVFMLEYTRASVIRQRFEREVNAFLHDKRCDRIVVIAHSLGTVIAYEGLTTALAQPDVQGSQKPITFLCLAQALRRIWLVSDADPHRVRSVLPDRVRWLHFWARYDPVAAGPLSARSLPPLERWPDPVTPNPYKSLCARLDRCENVDVVNADSIFSDHTTYWHNLEQVVGPIARELVDGHPELERVVQAHLATPDDVLVRRWRVAWRSTVALGAGIATGFGLVFVDVRFKLGVGAKILTFLQSHTFRELVIALLTGTPPIVRCEGTGCTTGVPAHLNPVDTVIKLFQAFLLTAAQTITTVLTVAAALAVAGIAVAVVGRIVALRPWSPRRDALRRGVIVMMVVATGLFLIDYFLNRTYGNSLPGYTDLLNLDIASVWLGVLATGVAWLLSLTDTLWSHRWAWFAGIALLAVLFAVLVPEIASAFSILTSGVLGAYLGTLIYGVMAGPAQSKPRRKP